MQTYGDERGVRRGLTARIKPNVRECFMQPDYNNFYATL